MPDSTPAAAAPITIKKYANRRLYNTATSSYVTLDTLCQMVKEGTEFVVYDAKSGEDITRAVLTQIIVEEEGKGQNLLPIGFLRQLIGFYGDNMQWLVPSFLESTMLSFARNQEQMRRYVQDTFGGMFPFNMEQMGKQNMALLERAMKMWSPFGGEAGLAPASPPRSPEAAAASAAAAIDDLKQQLAALQQQLDSMANNAARTPGGRKTDEK